VTRDHLKSSEWFDNSVNFSQDEIRHRLEFKKESIKNEKYRPQYIYEIASANRHLLLKKYSRGDSILELAEYILPLLEAWEEAEGFGKDVWTEQQQYTRHAWKVNLDHYINCFWLVGLALAFDIPDEQWNRLLVLIGNEGEDALLDRVIASRQQGRRIGTELCHPEPYARLLGAVLAPRNKQSELLKSFVDHWYAGLDRQTTRAMPAIYTRPYWYKYHELEGGYFGYWCIEAVAAVKAFGMDDSLCLGHPNYPGDLLRPEGPTTHLVGSETQSFKGTLAEELPKKRSFLSRLFRR